MESPKSLTAVVYVRFNYQDKGTEAKPLGRGELEMLNRLMDQACNLPVDLQEMLVKFGSYLKTGPGDGAEPK